MSTSTKKVKLNLFALLGRLIWSLLARIGLPYAKRKVSGRNRR